MRYDIGKLTRDNQNQSILNKYLPKIEEYCTDNEELLYIAIQNRYIFRFMYKAIILTNKRVILVLPTLVAFNIKEFYFTEIKNMIPNESLLRGSITVHEMGVGDKISEDSSKGGQLAGAALKSVSDRMEVNKKFVVNLLPKPQVRAVNKLTKEWIERAKKQRREDMLEEKRAAAGGVSVNVGTATQPSGDDSLAKLNKLKTMLEQGIITQSEFESKKAEILSKI